MSDTFDATRIPRMSPENAQDIARGLKWMAESYSQVGMTCAATRAKRDSQWWTTYSASLAQTPPAEQLEQK